MMKYISVLLILSGCSVADMQLNLSNVSNKYIDCTVDELNNCSKPKIRLMKLKHGSVSAKLNNKRVYFQYKLKF